MEVRKSLEQKTLILGVEIRDMGVALSLFFGVNIAIGMVRLFLPVSSWYSLSAIALVGVYMGVVRYGQKNKHPSYIVSLLSFHFFQPKRLQMKKFSFLK